MALWTPSEITTALWLDASDSSTLFDATSGGSAVAADGAVARWEDKSGNARHVTQATSEARPLRKAAVQNSRDVLRFDGTDDKLQRAAFVPNTFTAFVVAKRQDIANSTKWTAFSQNDRSNNAGRLIFYTERTSGGIIGAVQVGPIASQAGTPTGTFGIFAADRNGTVANIHRDGVSVSRTTGSATIQAVNFVVGANDTTSLADFADLDIGEILIVSGVQSTADRQQIEGYLAHKWGLTGNLPSDHPYKTAAPTTGTIQTRRRRSRGRYAAL
jgi:hypothetical protein